MKLLIASDIHGSAKYCQELLQAFQREEADRLLLLGDLLYHGPRNDLPEGHDPKQVIALLNPLAEKISCVRGNCEAEVDQMVLDFPVMADYILLEQDGISVFATHGHHDCPAQPPKYKGKFLLLNGHTHVPAFEDREGFWYANPGSVSIPKEGSCHSYLVMQDGTLVWKSLDGKSYRTEKLKK